MLTVTDLSNILNFINNAMLCDSDQRSRTFLFILTLLTDISIFVMIQISCCNFKNAHHYKHITITGCGLTTDLICTNGHS